MYIMAWGRQIPAVLLQLSTAYAVDIHCGGIKSHLVAQKAQKE